MELLQCSLLPVNQSSPVHCCQSSVASQSKVSLRARPGQSHPRLNHACWTRPDKARTRHVRSGWENRAFPDRPSPGQPWPAGASSQGSTRRAGPDSSGPRTSQIQEDPAKVSQGLAGPASDRPSQVWALPDLDLSRQKPGPCQPGQATARQYENELALTNPDWESLNQLRRARTSIWSGQLRPRSGRAVMPS